MNYNLSETKPMKAGQMNLLTRIGLVLLLSIGFSTHANAAPFSNRFVRFELPAKWQCTLEGAEFICQSSDPGKKRDAIIVLAAKLRGAQDSLEQYLDYLRQPKVYSSVQGKPVKSEVKSAKKTDIQSHIWVDALHFESEIPGFYTRYLATTKSDIGVLVTYSIVRNKYQEYVKVFEAMVKSLVVFRTEGAINANGSKGNIFDTIRNLPSTITKGTVFDSEVEDDNDDTSTIAGDSEDDSLFYMIFALIGIVGFVLWRKRRG